MREKIAQIKKMLELISVSKKYGEKKILSDLDFKFNKGIFYSIVGESGVGKTTLLSILSGIEKPDSGDILFNNKRIDKKKLDSYRRKNSIIFQQYNLINYLTAEENIHLGIMLNNGLKGLNRDIYTKNCLNKVGIDGRLHKLTCDKLSGGQQQRVAIARAIAQNGEILFADEPTGNLDMNNCINVTNIFKELALIENKCIICVTHSLELSKEADVVLELIDGKLVQKII